MINAPSSFQKHARLLIGQSSGYFINGEQQKLSCLEQNRALILNYFYQSIVNEGGSVRTVVEKMQKSDDDICVDKDSLINEIERRTNSISSTRKEIDDIIHIEFGEKGEISIGKILLYFKQRREFKVNA
jgi:hypothetical protein